MQEPKSASFLLTLKAVFWSFLGIRNRNAHQRETAKMKPVYIIFAGLLGVAIFIFVLLMVVRSVVGK
jgi:hypothetical protein